MTLSLATKDQGIVGNATILEMTLRPGNNTLPMTAIVDQVAVITEMNRSPGGIVDFLVTGTSSVYNGVHIPYYVCTTPPFRKPPTDMIFFIGESTRLQRASLEHEHKTSLGRQHLSVRFAWERISQPTGL